MNQIYGKGNLGADPELKETAKQKIPVLNMSIRFPQNYKDEKSGEWKDENGFWAEVDFYGERAPALADILEKGASVFVVGRQMPSRAYTDKDGEAQAAMRITADNIYLDPAKIDTVTWRKRGSQDEVEDGADPI